MDIKSLLCFSDESRSLLADGKLPKVLMAGLARSGKTSIRDVVFQKAAPHETLFHSSTGTPSIIKISNTNLVQLAIIDLPGSFLEPPDGTADAESSILPLLPLISAVVFVVDAQNEPYTSEVAYCCDLFLKARRQQPKVELFVFVHKVDGDLLALDDVRAEIQRDLHDKVMGHLPASTWTSADISFYSTSIYDHTVFEACSRLVQRLTPFSSACEELLDLLVASSRLERALLVDVSSKTFIATDSSPFDAQIYELCTDMIDVVVEVSGVYGRNEPKVMNEGLSAECPAMCLIQLNNGHLLYLTEVERCVVLACVIREEDFDRQHLVDYNIKLFKNELEELSKIMAT